MSDTSLQANVAFLQPMRLCRVAAAAAALAWLLSSPPVMADERAHAPAGFTPAHERASVPVNSMRVVGSSTPLRPSAPLRETQQETPKPVEAMLTSAEAEIESVLAEPVPAPDVVEEYVDDPGYSMPGEAFHESAGPWTGGEACGCEECGGGGYPMGEGPFFPGDHWAAKHDCLFHIFKHFQFFSGAHGFKNPGNRGSESSFGFHQGINFSANVPHCRELSFQVGAQVTESNLNSSIFTDDNRIQLFATGGVFRRVDCGFQGGAVIDYLHDEWDYEVDLVQLRAEISYIHPNPLRHELGFFAAVNTREKLVEDPFLGPVAVNTTDLFAFFYRCRFPGIPGSESRFFGGFSADSDGLVGGDYLMPVSANLAFQFDYAYLIPADELRTGIDESWNISFNIVWYPGCGFTAPNNYCRPLFNVANNGSMMLNDRQ
jgi:hypothetical protein